jgi:hypothetical protein
MIPKEIRIKYHEGLHIHHILVGDFKVIMVVLMDVPMEVIIVAVEDISIEVMDITIITETLVDMAVVSMIVYIATINIITMVTIIATIQRGLHLSNHTIVIPVVVVK